MFGLKVKPNYQVKHLFALMPDELLRQTIDLLRSNMGDPGLSIDERTLREVLYEEAVSAFYRKPRT